MTMLDRISREEMFIRMAEVAALRSTCQRLSVGCVITDDEGTQVLSIGYNGNARKLPNTCDVNEAGMCGCIHAEVNALLKAPYSLQSLVLYTTHSPCLACAKLILNSRVYRVVYLTAYRDPYGVQLLQNSGLSVTSLSNLLAKRSPSVFYAAGG